MKLLIGAIIAVCFSFTVSGQNTDIFKRNPMKEDKLKRLLQDSLQRFRPAAPLAQNFTPVEPGVMKLPLKGRYIGENGKGDEIYAMQPDNMPCLVPGKTVHFNMPVAGAEKRDNSWRPLLKKDWDKLGELENGTQIK